jgi:uncharacterized membrane protein YbhN (UPF0104 family)
MVLLVFATIGILVFSFAAPGPTAIDRAVTRLVELLPGLFGWFWEISYALLIVWAFVLIGGAAIARGRKGLLVDELLAILLAFGFAMFAGIVTGSTWAEMAGSLFRSHPPAVYPAMRLALASAVVVTASPHLTRPLRYIGRWVMAVGALAAIALGIAIPLGIFTGYSVGIAAASLVHLFRGSPGGRPTLEQVGDALDDLGVDAADLRHADLQPRGVVLVTGATRDGQRLLIKIYGRDAWEGQFFASAWMRLWHRDDEQRLGFSRLQQVEHEAFVTLLAERGGVPVLPVVAAGDADDGDALLVVEAVGTPLLSYHPGSASDALLLDLWRAVERLHDLGVAHGGLNGYRIVVRPDGTPALSGFDRAAVAPSEAQLLADRAYLLVTTALVVGQDRAVAAATASIGRDGLGKILPYLQPAVVDLTTRRAIHDRDWDVDDLRKLAAEAAGVDPPKLQQIRRVSGKSIAIVVLIGLLAYTLISALANVGLKSLADELRNAKAGWLIAALVLSPFIQLGQAVSTKGASVADVRYGPVLMLQYAIQFIALAVPSSAARVALEVRFFQCNGVDPGAAVSIGVIDSVCGFVVQLILILTITLTGLANLDWSTMTSSSNDSSSSSASSSGGISIWALLLALVVVTVVVVLVVPTYRRRVFGGIPRFQTALREQATASRGALRVLRSAKKDGMIFGGNLYAQILQAIILGLCLRAFGEHASLAGLILVNTFVSLFAGLMPVPGGMGVAEAGFTAGLVALGVSNPAAVSTAIAFRLVTFYVPPIWGTFAMRWLRKHAFV